MTIFLQSLGNQVAKAVTKSFSVPNGDVDTWSEITTKEFDANAKTHYVLLQALNDDDIARVIYCKSDHEIWSHMVVTHEGTLLAQGYNHPVFIVLMITKHMWLIKFKCLSIFQGSKDSRSFLPIKEGIKDSRRSKYRIKSQSTQTSLKEKPC